MSGFTVGEPVHVLHMAVYGIYADYMAVTADDVAPLPAGMDFDAAAAAFNYFVAWGLLNQIVQAAEGQTLYIGGAGGGIGTVDYVYDQVAGPAFCRQFDMLAT